MAIYQSMTYMAEMENTHYKTFIFKKICIEDAYLVGPHSPIW